MKVLIFTNFTTMYDAVPNHYYGNGWVSSLVNVLHSDTQLELAISFFHPTDTEKVERDSFLYYPMYIAPRSKNRARTIIGDWLGSIESETYYQNMMQVINDYKPDVIQVFGSEGVFPSIQKFTSVPVIVHLQGILNPYHNAFYPVGQSKLDFIFNSNYLKANIMGKGIGFVAKRIRRKAKREIAHFSNIKYVMGRTHWDKMVVQIHNPKIQYFQVGEILRPIFYEKSKIVLERNNTGPLKLITTISPTLYKGLDVILKTAKLLIENSNIDFTWSIIGLESKDKLVQHFERHLRIQHRSVNIEFMGICKANDFIGTLQDSDLYIHPSYIDNSPNSVCEAQILGVPVIACNVGGLSTLIEDGVSGRLIPSNGTYELVHCLLEFRNNPELYWSMADTAKEIALQRHDQGKILEMVVRVYQSLMEQTD